MLDARSEVSQIEYRVPLFIRSLSLAIPTSQKLKAEHLMGGKHCAHNRLLCNHYSSWQELGVLVDVQLRRPC